MIEIKFRKWIERYGEFIYLEIDELLQPEDAYYFPREDGIAQQFTGLKDKQSVDIWEGDILEGLNNNKIVKRSEKGACYFLEGEKTGPQVINQDLASIHRVVGNIHENPELIKVE